MKIKKNRNVIILGGVGGGGNHIQKGWGCSSYLVGVKKAGLVPLMVFNLKSSTARASAVPKNMTGDNILF